MVSKVTSSLKINQDMSLTKVRARIDQFLYTRPVGVTYLMTWCWRLRAQSLNIGCVNKWYDNFSQHANITYQCMSLSSLNGIWNYQARYIDVITAKYHANIAVKVDFPTGTTRIWKWCSCCSDWVYWLGDGPHVLSLVYVTWYPNAYHLPPKSTAPTQPDYAKAASPSLCSDNEELSHAPQGRKRPWEDSLTQY